MSKRPSTRNNEDMDLTEIYEHLSRQDKTLNEILTVIRGSVSMGVDGVLKKLKEVEEAQETLISDVAHLQRWKQMMVDSRGKVTITLSTFFTRVLALIGGIGTLIGVLLAFKQLLEK